jgi:hypothetical protein
MPMQKIKNFFNLIISKKKYIISIYAIFAIIASFQSFNSPHTTTNGGEISQTKYNNYVIFKQSFHHLIDGKDLYVLYPAEHWDLFKYTPTFAMLFGAFAVFPDWLGLNLWNLLNALILVFAVYYLPKFDVKQKGIILAICLLEMLTSMQNEQSNGLMAGLIVFAFGLLENKRYVVATLCIAMSVYVKLFGVIGVALFLLPLLLISVEQYSYLLQSYSYLLSNDHDISLGYSVMGWLNSWFNLNINKNIVVIFGGLLLLLPLLKIKNYKNYIFRLLLLASMLIWMVIFNHKAESPTFIIAISGIALWFSLVRQTKAERSKIEYYADILLFALAFALVSLSPTDIFPRHIREFYVHPYCLKAVPCIFIWFKILYEMLRFKDNFSNMKLNL